MTEKDRRSWLSVCLLALGTALAAPTPSFAEGLQSNHPALEQALLDQSLVDGLKARLSSNWQILGMDALPTYVQANLVGRAIGAAAKSCGLSMVWDDAQPARHAVWPVVLNDLTAMSLKAYLARPWAVADVKPPEYLQSAAEELAKRVSTWGIAFLTMSLERQDAAQEVDYVFIDGHRVTPEK